LLGITKLLTEHPGNQASLIVFLKNMNQKHFLVSVPETSPSPAVGLWKQSARQHSTFQWMLLQPDVSPLFA
jgi:hypothetical protein